MSMRNRMASGVAAACLMLTTGLQAATITWTGAGNGTSWNDTANWDAGVLPTSLDEASFTAIATSNKTVSLDAPQTVGQLKIAGTAVNLAFGSPADVSAGNALTLGTLMRIYYSGGVNVTITANVAVAANRGSSTWNIGRYGTLVAAGNINAAGRNLEIIGGALALSGNNTFSSMSVAVDTMTMSGNNTFSSMAVNGGTLTLSGNNTFSSMAANGGTLVLGSANTLGGAGTVSFGGGTLQLFDTTDLSGRFSQASNQLYNVSTPSNVTFATPLTSSGGSLSKSGAGKLTLSAANSYTGPTTLNAGTLTFSGAGALGSTTAPLTLVGGTLDLAGATRTVGDVNITGSAMVSNGTLNATSYTVGGTTPYIYGNLAGPGVGVTKSGAGTLVMYGANTYTGDTTVSNSALQLNFTWSTSPINNIISNASALKICGSTVSLYGKTSASSLDSQTVNGLTVYAPGASAFNIVNGSASGSTLCSLGAITHQAGGTVNFTQPTVNTAIGAANGYTTTTANTNGILGGWATVGNNNWAANNGTNIVACTGYTTLTGIGPTMPNDPTANLLLNTSFTGSVGQVTGTNTINTLLASVTCTNTIGAGNTLRLGAAGGILTTAGTLTLGAPGNAGALTAGGGNNTAGEIVINNTGTIIDNATISDNGSGAVTLVKLGAGKLTLTGASTYTGGTFLNAGSLYLPGVANALTTNTPLTILNNALLDLGGGTLTNRAGVSFIGTTTVTNGTLKLYGSSFNVQGGAVYANLGGSAGLLKTTSGTLNLYTNSYSGDTLVPEGTLTACSPNAFGSTANMTIGSPQGGLAASVGISANPTWTPAGPGKNYTIYANGSLNLFSTGYSPYLTGTLTLYGASFSPNWTFVGSGTAVKMTGGTFGGSNMMPYGNDGSFNITSYATSITANVSAALPSSHTFTVADGAAPIDLNFSGTAGTSVTKAGPGVMSITGSANTYTGATVISAGTLLVNNFQNYGTSGTGQGLVTTAVGATLGGLGFIGGVAGYSNANVVLTGAANTNSVATLAPGSLDSVTGSHVMGPLTVGSAAQTNSVTFGKFARLSVCLGAATPLCDCLVVNGSLNLGGASNSNYLDVATTAVTPKGGDYIVATFNVLTGRFCAVRSAPGALLPSRAAVKYNGTPSGRGNELLNGNIVMSLPLPGSIIIVQ